VRPEVPQAGQVRVGAFTPLVAHPQRRRLRPRGPAEKRPCVRRE
jgi:hypothetical protein